MQEKHQTNEQNMEILLWIFVFILAAVWFSVFGFFSIVTEGVSAVQAAW